MMEWLVISDWEEYLDRKEMKLQEVGEKCIMRSLIACTIL
jgi:hypothetical protein